MERDSDTNNDDDHEDILSTKEIQEKGFDETLELPEETEQVPKSLIEKKNEQDKDKTKNKVSDLQY